ncbi:methyltransferase domain-containing protein [Streptomyces capitiformicae]|uniref:hypothetical protein n=1 Tax=Streptomyces capitiformicae TaxID=2014920 RepID=UPI001AD81870|nr:hypothetical protein [Streptomyces capitiformicae]
MDTTGPHTAENLAARFHDVDSSGVPEDSIVYLRKMEESESGRTVREVTYRALEAAEGRGADIGCGAGRAVADLVRLGKDAVGVDSSQAMRPPNSSGRNRRCTNHFWNQTAFRARVATTGREQRDGSASVQDGDNKPPELSVYPTFRPHRDA